MNATSAPALKREFGPLLRAFARRYFEHVRFPPEAEATLSRLSAEGEVVHVMRSANALAFLYLDWALTVRGLPSIRAVSGLWRWISKPWRLVHQCGREPAGVLKGLEQGGSALVFLRRPRVATPHGHVEADPFPALIARQRTAPRPLFLVPELLAWERAPGFLKPGLIDILFGSPDSQGILRALFAFLRNYRRSSFRAGTPVDLKRFVEEHPGETDELLARKVRGALHHHLARQMRSVAGPPLKSPERVIAETLRDKHLRLRLEQLGKETGRSSAALTEETTGVVREVAARFSPAFVAVYGRLVGWLLNRLYDGVELDEQGLDRALKAAGRAPLVFCPSHKSHIDYLIMSWALFERGVVPPHVAAGSNLSFWPAGPLLRRGGGFFLRRSFRGDPVYSAAFRAYVKSLIKDGFTQEFFIEGGRSRTGKLLSPKLGMLTFQVEAFLEGAQDDLLFVPVAIDYEKVAESRAYVEELRGGQKKAEDLGAVIQARKVLKNRYGRIYLSFDEPISLADFFKSRGLDPQGHSLEERRSTVRALAQRIVYGISRASVVTPNALAAAALLAHRQRGITAREVGERIHFLRRLAESEGARLSRVLAGAPSDPTSLGPIGDAFRMFQRDQLAKAETVGEDTVFTVPDEARATLNFYKNNLLHLAVSRSLVATALWSLGLRAPEAELRERTLFLSRLFKFEFSYRVGASFAAVFEDTLRAMETEALIERAGELVRVAPEPAAKRRLAMLRDLVREFVESYRSAAAALPALNERPMDRKAFAAHALEQARSDFFAGRVGGMEALNRLSMENALSLFLDLGMVVVDGGGKSAMIKLSPEQQKRGKVEAFVAELDHLLHGISGEAEM